MMLKQLVRLLTLLLGLLIEVLAGHEATATIVVPMSDRDLAEHATLVVIGEVTTIESHWDPSHQQIFTYITLDTHEVLKGDAGAGPLTIRQVGGTVHGLESWVHGSPEFVLGACRRISLRAG